MLLPAFDSFARYHLTLTHPRKNSQSSLALELHRLPLISNVEAVIEIKALLGTALAVLLPISNH
jgi:hypothetical protein